MRAGIIGMGYWGNVLASKLDNPITQPPYTDADWMFIATPPKHHYEHVKEQLLNGKHVFCEKPFTPTLAEATELIDLANSLGKRLYIDNLFLMREEIVSHPRITTDMITSTWTKYGPFKDTLRNDLLYHDLYIIPHLLGPGTPRDIQILKDTPNVFEADYMHNSTLVRIRYNRESAEKKKTFTWDAGEIDLSSPQHDPLQETIDLLLKDEMDYSLNHKTTLTTIEHWNLF
jgi:hypothetical protein